MKELLFLLLALYIGFTVGLCLMDYISIRENYHLHLYKYSMLHLAFALILSPITFPFYLVVYIKDKFKYFGV